MEAWRCSTGHGIFYDIAQMTSPFQEYLNNLRQLGRVNPPALRNGLDAPRGQRLAGRIGSGRDTSAAGSRPWSARRCGWAIPDGLGQGAVAATSAHRIGTAAIGC
jgi:hypothetical protein